MTPGAVLHHMMSTSAAHPASASANAPTPSSSNSITINGVTYRQANHTHLFKVCETRRDVDGALMDGGANGGLLDPSEFEILEGDLINIADVIGVTSDTMSSLPIVQVVT